MFTVALGPVFMDGDGLVAFPAAQVRGHARAFVQDLNRGRRRADLHHFVHQVVRHAVEVRIEGDVIIDVDASAAPLAHVEGLPRQRLQGRLVDGLPHAGPCSIFLAERPMIQRAQQFANRYVKIFQRKELVMTQRRDDPTLRHLHGTFHLGFVTRLARARDHSLRSNGSVGRGFRAGRSMDSHRLARVPSFLRKGR